MKIDLRMAGSFMVLAGLLLITRLAPIFANLPEGLTDFPPANTGQLAMLAAHNTSGYHISHLMALLAMPLLWIGFLAHYQRLSEKGLVRRSIIGMTGISMGAGLFSIALLSDGFLMPFVSHEFMSPQLLDKNTAEMLVAITHKLSLSFFTPAMFSFYVGFGFFASPFAHGHMHNKWFGFAGIALANIGVFGFMLKGENFNLMPLGGLVMMATFFWVLALGISALRLHARERA